MEPTVSITGLRNVSRCALVCDGASAHCRRFALVGLFQYSSDKTKTLVETAIYRVSKTQNFCQ